eukprot:11210621-Lingulodinium_polyedra.AAC.1
MTLRRCGGRRSWFRPAAMEVCAGHSKRRGIPVFHRQSRPLFGISSPCRGRPTPDVFGACAPFRKP